MQLARLTLPITPLPQNPRQPLQILPIHLAEPVRLRAVDINNRHDLFKARKKNQLSSSPSNAKATPSPKRAKKFNPERHNRAPTLTLPSTKIGTTTSLLLSPSHAMCPGNSSTSGTSCVRPLAAAAPQTPRPKAIVWQATLPWKGPRMSCCLLVEEALGSRT